MLARLGPTRPKTVALDSAWKHWGAEFSGRVHCHMNDVSRSVICHGDLWRVSQAHRKPTHKHKTFFFNNISDERVQPTCGGYYHFFQWRTGILASILAILEWITPRSLIQACRRRSSERSRTSGRLHGRRDVIYFHQYEKRRESSDRKLGTAGHFSNLDFQLLP